MISTSSSPASSATRKQQSYVGLGLSSPAQPRSQQQQHQQQRYPVSANNNAWPSDAQNNDARLHNGQSLDDRLQGSPISNSLRATRAHGTGLSVHDNEGKLFGRRSFIAQDSPTSPTLGPGHHLAYASGRVASPSQAAIALDMANGHQASPHQASARQRVASSALKQDSPAYQVDYSKHSYLLANASSKPSPFSVDPRDIQKDRRSAHDRLQSRTLSGRVALYLRRVSRVQIISRAMFLLAVLIFLGALSGVGRSGDSQNNVLRRADNEEQHDNLENVYGRQAEDRGSAGRRGRPRRGDADKAADAAKRRRKAVPDAATKDDTSEDSSQPVTEAFDEVPIKDEAAATGAVADFGDGLVTDTVEGSENGEQTAAKTDAAEPTAADAVEEFEVNADTAEQRRLDAERAAHERELRPLKMRLAQQEKKRQKEALKQRVQKQKLRPMVGVRADRDETLQIVPGEDHVERKGVFADSSEQRGGQQKQGIKERIQAAVDAAGDEGSEHEETAEVEENGQDIEHQHQEQQKHQPPQPQQQQQQQQPPQHRQPAAAAGQGARQLLREDEAFEANLAAAKKALRHVRQGPAG